jgi:hypothetical protein
MPHIFYRADFNEIVVEVTESQVLSDLWDFPEPVLLRSILALEVRRERHPLATLSVPVLALLLAAFFGYALAAASNMPRAPKVAGACLIMVFLWSGIAGVGRFLRNRRNQLWLTTDDSRQGVLYFSQDDATFRRFTGALLAALRSRSAEMPQFDGAGWIRIDDDLAEERGRRTTG